MAERLDSYISKMFEEISRSKIQDLIKRGAVQVNGAPKKPSYILKEDDKVELSGITAEMHETEIFPEDIALNIVYEDENMLVVNKPSGMLTHPTAAEAEGTLVNALLFKYGSGLSDVNGKVRSGIVHRLDRNTSGLLMIAKNNKAHEFLAQQIKDRKVVKKYRAIAKGGFREDEFEINLPIGRHPKQPHKMAVVEDGRESVTRVKVLKHFKNAAYLELNLITGRTHQIRVHLSHCKHPVYNDDLYGSGRGKVKTDGQALQSFYLRFTKPFGDEIIELQIEPDEKIRKVLSYMERL
ncbi:MAG: RluA family pseudouridine synthase [Heliobacteriaceae bacterium]|jgi:23S rRNA pseudouridine1911/1915/1917 synthase|nr:RluA family pseudouridine synthase [Heliobacteriaceae bacterium]